MTRLSHFACIAGAFAVAVTLNLTQPAVAHETIAGDLTIGHPYARPNLPNRPSAAYLSISNDGEAADRLIAADSEAFGTIEIHTVEETNGVMKMLKIEGIDVPPGDTALLEPGGFHLMLFDAAQTFKIGDHFDATLTFEKAGDVTVTFMVEKPAAESKSADHSGHGAKGHSAGTHSGHGSGN
ncbi:MAG: copper chaperone PCu(A)C [Pseudomonadota bacterium]